MHTPLPMSPRRVRSFASAVACLVAAPFALAEPPVFETNDQELLYYWGTTYGEQLEAARVLDTKEIEWVLRGLRDRAQGKAPQFGDEYPSLLNNYLVARTADAARAEASASAEYVATMAREPNARTMKRGLVYREIAAGKGANPTRDSKVRVHYVGTLRDGKVFDSSRERGSPLEARLASVIPCWQEGIALMKPGGRAQLTCPPGLAYGERGNARIPGGSALVFDVELIEVVR